jgi:hypothetical protein
VSLARPKKERKRNREKESRDRLVASRDLCFPRDRFCVRVCLAGKKNESKKKEGKAIRKERKI